MDIDKVIVKLESRLAEDKAKIDNLVDKTLRLILSEAKSSSSISCITKKHCKFLLHWNFKFLNSKNLSLIVCKVMTDFVRV